MLAWKSVINISKYLKQCSTSAKQSRKSNILICSKLLKLQASPKFHQPACQPASLPACRMTEFYLAAGRQTFHGLCTVPSKYKFFDPLKISPLNQLAYFYHHWPSFFFFVPQKGTKFTKEEVNRSIDKL